MKPKHEEDEEEALKEETTVNEKEEQVDESNENANEPDAVVVENQTHEEEHVRSGRRGRPSKLSTSARPTPTPEPGTPRRGRGRGRGTPGRAKSAFISTIPLDPDGQRYEVIDDEISLPPDPDGETKVNKNGELLGGREYRVRTFTVAGRGDRLYMLSTEPARCIGFRDSYLLFQKHKRLHKIIVSDDEKYDLIARDVIPHSYKGRAIGIVSARSIYREFGARIVVGGKRIIDDYYEVAAKDLGYVAGDRADPDDPLPPPGVPYNRNQYVAWHGASSVYHQNPLPVANPVYKENMLKQRKSVVVTDENWMLEHATAASNYNHEITLRRQQAWKSNGVYEPYTGVKFYPSESQPKRAKIDHVSKKVDLPSEETKSTNPRIVIETVLEISNSARLTGLKDVPPEIFENADPEIKEAIIKQQELERERE